jgi:hypothetical protein
MCFATYLSDQVKRSIVLRSNNVISENRIIICHLHRELETSLLEDVSPFRLDRLSDPVGSWD